MSFQFADLLTFICFVFIVTIYLLSFISFETKLLIKCENMFWQTAKYWVLLLQPTNCVGWSSIYYTVPAPHILLHDQQLSPDPLPTKSTPHFNLAHYLVLAAETYQATLTSYTSEQLRKWRDCVRVAGQGSISGRAEALHLHDVQNTSESAQSRNDYTSRAHYSHESAYTLCTDAKLTTPPPQHIREAQNALSFPLPRRPLYAC
jgi:hypothetical protein